MQETNMNNRIWAQGLLIALLWTGTSCRMLPSVRPCPPSGSLSGDVLLSTVKIHTTTQADDFSNPWRASRPSQGNGTGFVIHGKRILTNAHVISNSRFLEVQKNGDPKRYIAHVRFAGHDCDLALLDVDDPNFFEGTQPVSFADTIPGLGDTVTAIGFPLGGDRVSLTRGVVSRIDQSGYSHSAIDQHMVLQVDAAINPGNSGGPIFYNGKVVGVAFQGLSIGDNIGYAIPIPVIKHFLDDVEDGHYDGYPELGMDYLELRNPAMRKSLGVPPSESGVVVTWLDPFGSAYPHLKAGDVLLSIDNCNIGEDGTIVLDGNPVQFTEILERRQVGDSITVNVFRDSGILTLAIPLLNSEDPFIFRNLYDVQPEYAILGGLVFAPLNREILKTIRSGFSTPNDQSLLYLSRYAKLDGFYRDHDQFVILIRRLPHPVNTYTDDFMNGHVVEVNGVAIRCMQDLLTAFSAPVNGFHRIRFAGTEEPLILDAEAVKATQDSILGQYGVPAPFCIHRPGDLAHE